MGKPSQGDQGQVPPEGLQILQELNAWAYPEGGKRVKAPLKNHKNIGFPSNIDPDSLKITKLPSQHSMVGHYWYTSKTPFQWCYAGKLMMAHFKWHFDPLHPIY